MPDWLIDWTDKLVTGRLDNADQALENLHFYQNFYQTEEPWLSVVEQNVSRLPAATGRLDEAQRDIDSIMVRACCICKLWTIKVHPPYFGNNLGYLAKCWPDFAVFAGLPWI